MLMIFIAIFVFLLYRYGLMEMLSLEKIFLIQQKIFDWVAVHRGLSLGLYFLSFLVLEAVNFPLAVVIPILGGYFLNFWFSVLLGVVALTLACVAKYAYIKSAMYLFNTDKWFPASLDAVLNNFKVNKFYYLFTLRFIPIFPSWALIVLVIKSGMSCLVYCAWTLLGTIPVIFIHVFLGSKLGMYLSAGNLSWEHVLVQPQVIYPFAIIGLISLSPLLIRLKSLLFKKSI